MSTEEKTEAHSNGEIKPLRLFRLIIIGFFIIFVGIVILIIASLISGGDISFGAFILIGPIPIMIGAGSEAQWLILIGMILTIISVVTYLTMRRRMRKDRD